MWEIAVTALGVAGIAHSVLLLLVSRQLRRHGAHLVQLQQRQWEADMQHRVRDGVLAGLRAAQAAARGRANPQSDGTEPPTAPAHRREDEAPRQDQDAAP